MVDFDWKELIVARYADDCTDLGISVYIKRGGQYVTYHVLETGKIKMGTSSSLVAMIMNSPTDADDILKGMAVFK